MLKAGFGLRPSHYDGADADQFMVAVRDYLENFNDDIE